MAILVDEGTKLCVSGITGREGTFHGLNNRRYGTQVVSGVTPGKGGQDVEGVPVFNTFHAAVARRPRSPRSPPKSPARSPAEPTRRAGRNSRRPLALNSRCRAR